MAASSNPPPNQNPNSPLHPVAAAANSAAAAAATATATATAAAAAAAATAVGRATASELPKGRRRELEDGGFYETSYFKIRSIVRDLRPFFIEVLAAPDVRKSNAAYEINKRMKIMVQLLKQPGNETAFTGKSFDPCMAYPSSHATMEELSRGLQEEVKLAHQFQTRNEAVFTGKSADPFTAFSHATMEELSRGLQEEEKLAHQYQTRNQAVFTGKSADPFTAFSHATMEELSRGLQEEVKLEQQFINRNVPDASANFMKEAFTNFMKEACISGNLQQKVSQGPQSQPSDTVINKASVCEDTPGKSVKRRQKVSQAAKFQQKVPRSGKVGGGSGEVKIQGLKEHGRQMEGNYQGTYVVGGSPYGWNFILYPGDKPVYYGVTKASMLARRSSAK